MDLQFELFGLAVLLIVWGGFGYFIYRASQSEKRKKAE